MEKQAMAASSKDGSYVHETGPNPQTRCTLFALPPELRNEIYALVFDVPPNDSGRVRLSKTSHQAQHRPTVLSILQTCKLIRDEAEGLFYSKHHLEIVQISRLRHGVSDIEGFIKVSNIHRLAAIRTLTVLVENMECVTKFFRISQALVGLSSLALVVGGQSYYPLETWDAKGVTRELPILKKAVKHLPVSLSHFRLRLRGNIHHIGRPGWVFESEIDTADTLGVETAISAMIDRRANLSGVMSDLNRFSVQV